MTITALDFFATCSIKAREDSLPISSSGVINISTGFLDPPISRRNFTAHIDIMMPDFMSNTPGPDAILSFSKNGIVFMVPAGQTVS